MLQEYYHELHRPSHFLQFSKIEEHASVGADREDLFH
jgi:pre-mRNA-processing factor 8